MSYKDVVTIRTQNAMFELRRAQYNINVHKIKLAREAACANLS